MRELTVWGSQACSILELIIQIPAATGFKQGSTGCQMWMCAAPEYVENQTVVQQCSKWHTHTFMDQVNFQ